MPAGSGPCAKLPCTCSTDSSGKQFVVEAADPTSKCYKTDDMCFGTGLPYEMALAATFLEGLVFMLICFLGLRR